MRDSKIAEVLKSESVGNIVTQLENQLVTNAKRRAKLKKYCRLAGEILFVLSYLFQLLF